MTSAPASAAASTSSAASVASPLWLMPASAMIRHGCPGPTSRLADREWSCHDVLVPAGAGSQKRFCV